ncbi:MAG: hypothetical protein FWB83_01850 [Treponema sp.]|nr:hypothetical protein [Treponema sp.]
MRIETLNEFFSDYTAGILPRPDLEGLIYSYFFYNQEKTCLSGWKRDEYEDYISWFYQRISRVIDTYNDIGASFESYISKFMLISSREFRMRITSRAITEHSAWNAKIQEMYAYEEPPAYHLNNAKPSVIKQMTIDGKGRKNTTRILSLILKCYYYISDDFADKIAQKIGIDQKELSRMLGKMRKIRQKRDDKIYRLRESMYCQYYRCMVYEKKLSMIKENITARDIMKDRLTRARRRLESMRRRMEKVRKEATNQQIADVIGISKGTVDANLYRLKNKWEALSKKADLN